MCMNVRRLLQSHFYIVSFRKWSHTLRINFHLICIECDARSDYRLGFYHSLRNVILSMIKREYSLLNRMRQNYGLYQRCRIFLVRPRAREREIFWKFVILEEVLKIVIVGKLGYSILHLDKNIHIWLIGFFLYFVLFFSLSPVYAHLYTHVNIYRFVYSSYYFVSRSLSVSLLFFSSVSLVSLNKTELKFAHKTDKEKKRKTFLWLFHVMDSKCPYFCWLSFLYFISQRLLIFRLIEMFSNTEIVSCFYCKWTDRQDKLASHSNTHHPGSKVFHRLRKEQTSNGDIH
jgi:hypothetical protein